VAVDLGTCGYESALSGDALSSRGKPFVRQEGLSIQSDASSNSVPGTSLSAHASTRECISKRVVGWAP
jgi:hypothetical protein